MRINKLMALKAIESASDTDILYVDIFNPRTSKNRQAHAYISYYKPGERQAYKVTVITELRTK